MSANPHRGSRPPFQATDFSLGRLSKQAGPDRALVAAKVRDFFLTYQAARNARKAS